MSNVDTPQPSPIERAKTHLSPATACKILLPDGCEDRGEWVARNPTRTDKNAGSFRINLTTGAWADFACGDKGTDSVSLWAYVRGVKTQVAAANEMLAYAPDSDVVVKQYQRKPPVQVQWPLPDDGPRPPAKKDIIHKDLGKSDQLHMYLAADKKLIGFVARWEATRDKPKEIRPYFFGVSEDGQGRWRWCGPTGKDPRPLYGMDRLGPSSKKVLIVEGESTCEAAHRLLGSEYASLSWLGGADAADKVDLSPIQGRTVALWPDFDSQADKPIDQQPGMRAMLTLAERLVALQCRVILVRYRMGERVSGWDLADAEAEKWTREMVLDYIHANGEKVGAKKPELEYDDTFGLFRPYAVIPHDMFDFVKTAGGKPLEVWQNIGKMLHLYGIRPMFNEMTRQPEFISKHDVLVAEAKDLCTINQIPSGSVFEKIDICARKNSRHPARDWIMSKAWDKKPRIVDLADTLDVAPEDADITRSYIKRWMISAVALLLQERGEPCAAGMIILTGPQHNGKTSWIRNLAPAPMVLTGSILTVENKDSLDASTCAWITELGEIDRTFERSNPAALKNFVTRPSDRVRLSYRRDWEDFPRRTVFAGTANDDKLFIDTTGNRRYWLIKTGKIAWHGIDHQQAWAEALELYRRGEQWALSPEELVETNARNDDAMAGSGIEDVILTGLDWPLMQAAGHIPIWLAPGEILRRLKLPVTSGTARIAAKVLSRITEERPARGTRLFACPRNFA